MVSEKISVRFCPKCKSVNVRYVFGLGNLFGVIPKVKCVDCGFEAPSFPVLSTTKKDLDIAMKNLKKKNDKAKKKKVQSKKVIKKSKRSVGKK